MASQALTSALEGVFAMSHTIGLTKASFLAYLLPPFVCQYLMGVLVQLKGTRTYRRVFLPVTLCLAWSGTFVDMTGGDPAKAGLNVLIMTQMCIIVTRCTVWAFSPLQYRRQSLVDSRTKPDPDSVYTACWNTWDLLLNTRGIGWNWSRKLIIPKPVLETDSRVVFVLWTAVGFALHAVALDACAQTIRFLSPETFGSPNGGSLFDHTLPPVLELLRAMLVSILTAAAVYHGLQHTYHLLAIVCVTLFQQRPSQWPPLFNTPWLSTSLSELWSRRWHQMMRDSVLNLGYRPFSYPFGKLGGLLGAFLVSGVFHNFDLGRRGYSVVCLGFWVMNAVGIILERLWQKGTGRLPHGVWGWAWTATWLFLWGVPMVDVYAQTGRLGALSVVGGFEPSLALVALVRRLFSS